MVEQRLVPITWILSDLDGVIRTFDRHSERQAEKLSALPEGALRAVAFRPDLLRPAITGAISDTEWRRRIATELARQFPGDHTTAVAQWSRYRGQISQPVLDMFQRARSKAKLALITNATDRLAEDLEQLALHTAFDDVISSADIGYIKPDAAIFEAALMRLTSAPNAVVYIDDNAANVAAAEALGIRGHIFKNSIGLQSFLAAEGIGA